jgi:hypothetical protein
MILMEILPVMRKYQIGRNLRFQFLEIALQICSDIGEKTIPEFFDSNIRLFRARKEESCAVPGFDGSQTRRS